MSLIDVTAVLRIDHLDGRVIQVASDRQNIEALAALLQLLLPGSRGTLAEISPAGVERVRDDGSVIPGSRMEEAPATFPAISAMMCVVMTCSVCRQDYSGHVGDALPGECPHCFGRRDATGAYHIEGTSIGRDSRP